MKSNSRRLNKQPLALLLALLSALSACSSPQDELNDMGAIDAATQAKHGYLALRWDQPMNVGSYNLSNLLLDEGAQNPKLSVYLAGGYTDTRYFFEVEATDPAIPVGNDDPFLELKLGWAPELNRQGIGPNPANWLELKLSTPGHHIRFCYAKPTSVNLYDIKTGKDDTGKYVELNTGPLPIFAQENETCEGSSPRMPRGTMSVVVHYRCKDAHPLEFPKWACQ